jgi:hypothetical protein
LLLLQVACTLLYSDVNVTELAPGSRIQLCNADWQDIREFNAVAYEVGSARYRRIPQRQQVRPDQEHHICKLTRTALRITPRPSLCA